MKRRLESRVVRLDDVSPEIASKILIPYKSPFSRDIAQKITSFSLISKKAHHLTTHPTFHLSLKRLLLDTLQITTFSSPDENLLISIFGNFNISVKNVWLYVYQLMAWLRGRLANQTPNSFKFSVLTSYPHFVTSPKPTDLMILSVFYPHNMKMILPYISHILKSKNTKIDKIPKALYKSPLDKNSKSILESVGNIFVNRNEEMNVYDSEEHAMVCFTFKMKEQELFCVVRGMTRRDDSELTCVLVDVKEKKKLRMKELEPLLFSIASLVSEELINYEPGINEGVSPQSPNVSPRASTSTSPVASYNSYESEDENSST